MMKFKDRGKMISKTRTRFFCLLLSKCLFNFMFSNEKKKAPQSLLCRNEHKRCSLNPEKNHRVRFISDCLHVNHIFSRSHWMFRVNELNKFLLIREINVHVQFALNVKNNCNEIKIANTCSHE